MTQVIVVDNAYPMTPEYQLFVKMILEALNINCTIDFYSLGEEGMDKFDIIIDDDELAFKLKLQDFSSAWQECTFGETGLKYQYEMLDEFTANLIATELRKILTL